MKIIKGFSFLCLAVFAGSLVHAEIYKWTDSSGSVHYSDTPQPGAQRMELPGIQSFSPPDPGAQTQDPASDSQTLGDINAVKGYKTLTIVQPADQATIRNNQGYVLVNVDIDPALKTGDSLQIVFDGNPFGKPQTNQSFAFSNVDRGTHSIAAQVLDKNGHMILTSQAIQFFMQRPRVNMGGV